MWPDETLYLPMVQGEVVCPDCRLVFWDALDDCPNCEIWGNPELLELQEFVSMMQQMYGESWLEMYTATQLLVTSEGIYPLAD
jgi:hypothetical protein